jgi:hypothetical protein
VELYLHSSNTLSWRGAQGQLYLYFYHIAIHMTQYLNYELTLYSACREYEYIKSVIGLLIISISVDIIFR